MISLKRNRKGEPVEANGIRKKGASIYKPYQETYFKISRSKFNDFLDCKRCFYLDRVKGLIYPSTPRWTLNETTDILLKREFDTCREQQLPHRLFETAGLTNVVPFSHVDLEKWRDSLHHGLQHAVPGSNIILHGGIDDIWIDQSTGQLIIVDYKSQSTNLSVTTRNYLAGDYHRNYKIQLDFYAYLLTNMGFELSALGYFFVCNADRSAQGFYGTMKFEETLVPYEWNIEWIECEISGLIRTLNSTVIPDGNKSCENCAYSKQRANYDSVQCESKELMS